jgi:hypothetical protein
MKHLFPGDFPRQQVIEAIDQSMGGRPQQNGLPVPAFR